MTVTINDDDVQKTISTVTASELPHSGKDTATLVQKEKELRESIKNNILNKGRDQHSKENEPIVKKH